VRKNYDNKASFIKLLNAYQIEFKQIKHDDPTIHNYPDLVEETNTLSVAALKRKKWIIMSSRDFKKMVLCLRTSRAEQIREYYLAVEDLFKMYCEYTLHFQLRREKRRLGKKQGTIDDLVRGMEEMKLERKETERKHEEAERKHEIERKEAQQRYNNLMARGDQLLHHAEQAEEDRIHRLFRQLFQGLRVPGVHLVESGLEGFPATGILHRAENEDLAVGGNIERCIGIRTNQLQHRLFDHQCQAVSVFSQGFDQGSDLPFLLTHCYYKDTTNKRPGQGPPATSTGEGGAKFVRGLLLLFLKAQNYQSL
jgi:hypothetical protein